MGDVYVISMRTLSALLLLMCLWPLQSMAATSVVADEERAWVETAIQLVEAADSGRAEALAFRRQVQQSREALREMVRVADPDDRARFQNMILMVALLDAAAACHRGGVIVCPPDLMRQMREQISRLEAQIAQVG